MRFAPLLFAIPAAVTAVLLINFCALIFHCGCHSLWSGASIHCDIHMAGMRHCPWCTGGRRGHKIALTLVVAAQLLLGVAATFGLAQGYWSH